jgi:hypothetical protein
VTDPQNAVIVGAEVKVTDVATNAVQTALTNETGRYVFVNVPSGVYNLTYSKAGFSQGRVMGQKVEVGSVLTLNTTLQVGATSTTIEIKASAGAELQTTNASVGTTITSEALMMLPNMGRDVSTLAVLQPGTTPGGFTAGAYADQNSYTLDGGNNSYDMAGNNTSYVTNFTGPEARRPTQLGRHADAGEGIRSSAYRALARRPISTIPSAAGSDGDRGAIRYHGRPTALLRDQPGAPARDQ